MTPSRSASTSPTPVKGVALVTLTLQGHLHHDDLVVTIIIDRFQCLGCSIGELSPLFCLILLAHQAQDGCIRIKECWGVGIRKLRVELWDLEFLKGKLELAQIQTGS